MFLAALIDAGVSPKIFKDTVAALNIGATLEISKVNRSGISATKIDVIVNGEKDSPREIPTRMSDPHEHSHSHDHTHPHDHHHHDSHDHAHHETHAHDQPHGRGLTEIRDIIRKSAISAQAKTTAIAIFEKLGAAESKIHNVPLDQIHFHEVGAADALVDIICAAVGAEALAVAEFICSPLNVGGDTVVCAHGTFPVPAPATVELLKGAPVYSSGVQSELVTPTGAAIVATLATHFSAFPEMKIETTGYGAGTRDFPARPNVLRITIGESCGEGSWGARAPAHEGSGNAPSQDTIAVLEANLDDLNPQVFGYVMDRLLEAGALDVFATPVQMKKNRPGTMLTILAKPEDTAELTEIIFAETTTLGVRRREESRQILARKWNTVSTRFGDVRIKIASLNGTVTSYAPEYEDCRRLAAEHRVPLKLIMQEAVQQYLQSPK